MYNFILLKVVLSKKCCFRWFFNQIVRASTCCGDVFVYSGQLGGLHDSLVTQRSAPGKCFRNLKRVLLASCWSHVSHLWLPSRTFTPFLQPFRLELTALCQEMSDILDSADSKLLSDASIIKSKWSPFPKARDAPISVKKKHLGNINVAWTVALKACEIDLWHSKVDFSHVRMWNSQRSHMQQKKLSKELKKTVTISQT
jgi:hypothetical protein